MTGRLIWSKNMMFMFFKCELKFHLELNFFQKLELNSFGIGADFNLVLVFAVEERGCGAEE